MSGDTARMLNREGWTCLLGVHEPGEYDRCEDCQDSCDELAEFLTPILRAAQADAWDEGENAGFLHGRWDEYTINPYRYERED